MSEGTTSIDISEGIRALPVIWLAQPMLAASAALPGARDAAQPKIAPLVAAAIGVAVGAGIQIGAQQLRKSGPPDLSAAMGRVCVLSIGEIEANASHIYREALAGAKDSPLNAIAAEQPGAKVLPVAAAAFLAGVATGAAAARN